jgi:hypothetical protein
LKIDPLSENDQPLLSEYITSIPEIVEFVKGSMNSSSYIFPLMRPNSVDSRQNIAEMLHFPFRNSRNFTGTDQPLAVPYRFTTAWLGETTAMNISQRAA